MSNLPLAAEFPAVSEDEWRERVARVLNGASADTLIKKTLDGIEIQPLYAAEQDTAPVVQRPRQWSSDPAGRANPPGRLSSVPTYPIRPGPMRKSWKT